jgi:predicted MFS family arabinose efflux permease
MVPAPPYALVWLLFVYAWISNYLVRIGFSALLPPIMQEFDLSYTRAGLLASGFFLAYTLMQMPAGLLGDRFGWRRILVLGLVGGALASAITGFAGSFALLLAARVLTGIGQGCLFSNDRAIIASITPPDKIALGQAVSFTGPGFGITLGLLLGGLLGEVLPWRAVFWLFALPPLVAALLIVRLVPAARGAAPGAPLLARLGHVVGQRDVWLLGASGFTVMWVQYVLATWAPLLFLEVGVTELGQAGLYSSLQGIAGVVGLVAGGAVADRARRHGIEGRVVMAAGLATVTVTMAGLAAIVHLRPSPVAVAAGLLIVSVCAWSVWGPAFALLGEAFRGRDLSTAFGLYNTVCAAGAVVGPAVMGVMRDGTGSFAAGVYASAAVALGGALLALAVGSAPPRPSARTL